MGHPRHARRPGHQPTAGHAGLPRHVSRTRASLPRPSRPLTCSATAALSAASVPAGGCGASGVRSGLPSNRQRLDQLQVCIETLRALWAPGTKAYNGRYVHLPETTCYPRPVSDVPIIVGGSGERRTLRIVAEQADGCNLPSDQAALQPRSTSCGGIASRLAAIPPAWRSPSWTCR